MTGLLFCSQMIQDSTSDDRTAMLWSTEGEVNAFATPVVEKHHFGGGSMMVWCGISPQNKTDVQVIDENMNVQRYQDEILTPVVTPFILAHPHLMMQDNATSHSARAS